jgi:hypothetical protein
MSLAVGREARTPSGFERLAGVTGPTSREPRPGFLTDTIVELGLADEEHVDSAIQESRVRGIPPESLLVAQGQIDDEGLARARAERAGLDYVDLSEFARDSEADGLIRRSTAERHRALPIAVEGRAIIVALADPIDAPAVADLAALEKREVIPVVAAADALEERIEQLPEHLPGEDDEALPQPTRLQAIEGGGATSASTPGPGIPERVADRIVARAEDAIGEVARSEILKALDEATAEIEALATRLAQAEERGNALEAERDALRAELSD